jgi:hypothetical protein
MLWLNSGFTKIKKRAMSIHGALFYSSFLDIAVIAG